MSFYRSPVRNLMLLFACARSSSVANQGAFFVVLVICVAYEARRQRRGRGAMPPDFFLAPPRYFFGRKKLVFLGGKHVKICDFGQKKPSDFGEDIFFYFYFFGDHLLLVGKFVISARKPLPP